MGIGKEVLSEVKGIGPEKLGAYLGIALSNLEMTTTELIHRLPLVDKATFDWEKDGSIEKLDPKVKAEMEKQLKSLQTDLDKIATLAEIFQREVLPRFKGGK